MAAIGDASGSTIEPIVFSPLIGFTGVSRDFDGDHDVDDDDLDALAACWSGPDTDVASDCAAKDLDRDSDVDAADYALFQLCMSGENNPAPASCTTSTPKSGTYTLHGLPVDVLPGGKALVFARARHYDLQLGRWLQRDPKGYVDGPNLYEAFGGNPLSHVDPDGTRYKLASGWANGDELVWQDYGYFTGVTADFSVGRYYCLGGEKFVTYSSPFIDDPNPNVDFYVLPLAIVEQWGQGQLSQGLYNHWVGLFGIPYHRDDDGNVQRIERDPWEAGVTVIGQLTEQNRMAIRRIYNWCTTGPGDRVLTMVTRGADPVTGQNVTEKDAKEVVANITWYAAQAWLAGRLVGPGVVQSPSAAPMRLPTMTEAANVVSRGAQLRVQYGAVFEEYMRFREQGFAPTQAKYLCTPYEGWGHHFLARRYGLPDFITESPLNIMKPNGISVGRFYERHFFADPYFYGTKLPRSVGGSWSGRAIGLDKPGLAGRLWYASPDPLKAAAGAAAAAGGAGLYFGLQDDE